MKILFTNILLINAEKGKTIKSQAYLFIKALVLVIIMNYCLKIKKLISKSENFMKTDKIRFNYFKKNYGYILKMIYLLMNIHIKKIKLYFGVGSKVLKKLQNYIYQI